MSEHIVTPKGTVKLLKPFGGLFEYFYLTQTDPKPRRCGNCDGRRRPPRENNPFNHRCGRCGVLLHAQCWERALTPAERENFFGNDETTWAAICLRCRS